MIEMQKSGTPYDQEIVDYLGKEKFDYFDMNEVHLRDFKKYSMPFDAYLKYPFSATRRSTRLAVNRNSDSTARRRKPKKL
jgi:hypothetical protein